MTPTSTTSTSVSSVTASSATTRPVVIAWQPSHQDDTGNADWHEYQVCGDIVERAIALLPTLQNVLAWETTMGLTGTNNFGGTNTRAFDSEIEKANLASAHYFISVHVDGDAPSGILGMYFTGDKTSAQYAEAVAGTIATETGLPFRGVRAADLYSLDRSRNEAEIRVLLELGDNVRDRALLEDPEGRAKIARALADAVRSYSQPID